MWITEFSPVGSSLAELQDTDAAVLLEIRDHDLVALDEARDHFDVVGTGDAEARHPALGPVAVDDEDLLLAAGDAGAAVELEAVGGGAGLDLHVDAQVVAQPRILGLGEIDAEAHRAI